ncbi:hypothetical protein D5086_018421 [Populus alba]|uniref:Uncharacterized protein n=1 Tax=Populus alba TaxID=43335 RepID=A0ACC4BQ91_POPAL
MWSLNGARAPSTMEFQLVDFDPHTRQVASIRGQEVNRTRNRSRCRDHPRKKKTAANLSVSGNSLQIWNVENLYMGISCLEEEILMGFTHHSSLHPLYFI